MLVRDLEEELCRHERLQEAQARAAAGLPALASPLPLGVASPLPLGVASPLPLGVRAEQPG